MAKIYLFILSIIGFIGSILFMLLILQVIATTDTTFLDYSDNDITFLELRYFASITSMNRVTSIMAFLFLIYCPMILFFVHLISLKKKFLLIGIVFSILGSLIIFLSWILNQLVTPMFIIGTSFYSIGFSIIGLYMISYYEYTKKVAILSPIMALITLYVFTIMSTFRSFVFHPDTILEYEKLRNSMLLHITIYHFLFYVYVLLFSLFFKQRHYLDHSKEERSLLDDTGFPTYLYTDTPVNDKNPSKKGKKKKIKDSSSVDFDF